MYSISLFLVTWKEKDIPCIYCRQEWCFCKEKQIIPYLLEHDSGLFIYFILFCLKLVRSTSEGKGSGVGFKGCDLGWTEVESWSDLMSGLLSCRGMAGQGGLRRSWPWTSQKTCWSSALTHDLAAALNQGQLHPPDNTDKVWRCCWSSHLERRLLLASSGWRPGCCWPSCDAQEASTTTEN